MSMEDLLQVLPSSITFDVVLLEGYTTFVAPLLHIRGLSFLMHQPLCPILPRSLLQSKFVSLKTRRNNTEPSTMNTESRVRTLLFEVEPYYTLKRCVVVRCHDATTTSCCSFFSYCIFMQSPQNSIAKVNTGLLTHRRNCLWIIPYCKTRKILHRSILHRFYIDLAISDCGEPGLLVHNLQLITNEKSTMLLVFTEESRHNFTANVAFLVRLLRSADRFLRLYSL